MVMMMMGLKVVMMIMTMMVMVVVVVVRQGSDLMVVVKVDTRVTAISLLASDSTLSPQ